MPQSRDPRTDPRAKLGEKLRQGRVAAGYASQDALAAKIPCDRSTIGHAESGNRPPKPGSDLLAAWAELCNLNLEVLTEWAEVAAVYDGAVPVWFSSYRDEVESAAHTIRTWQPIIVPGLLQTTAYAETLFVAMGYDSGKIEDFVSARIERQSILDRAEPPNLWVVLDESVLRRHVGSETIMHEQLEYLAERGQRVNIGIQVVPAVCGASAGCVGALTIASVDAKPDVLLTEAVEDQTTEHAPMLRKAHEIFDRVRYDALPRAASLELIREVAEQWKTQA
jgi:transcriptional regulator with XRE-family HTH domain